MNFKLIIAFCLCFIGNLLFAQKGESIPNYDGVFIVQADNQVKELLPCKTLLGHRVTSYLGSWWKYPKKYFTLDSTIVNISSFKKLILKGTEYDAQTMKYIGFLEMNKIKLGMPFFHSGKEKIYKKGIAYIDDEESEYPFKESIRKHSKSDLEKEITVTVDLKKNIIFAFWINKSYYMFRIQ